MLFIQFLWGNGAVMEDGSVKSANAPESGFLLLDPRDNILISVRSVPSGTVAALEDGCVTLCADIGLGHKIARHALAAGDKVYRYGFPIGTMTQSAERGEHVHHHNLASDYIAAHGRDASSAGGAA